MAANDKFIKNEKKQSLELGTMMVTSKKEEKRNSNEKKDAKRMCFAFDFNSFVLCAKCKADERKTEPYSSLVRRIVRTYPSGSCVLCGVPHVSIGQKASNETSNVSAERMENPQYFVRSDKCSVKIGSDLH